MAEDFFYGSLARARNAASISKRGMALCRVFAAVPKGLRGIREKAGLCRKEMSMPMGGSLRTLYLLLFIACIAICENAAAADNAVTAREIFAKMPESIFESTAEGLDDKDKQDLLNCGRSEFWEIIQETPDAMVFSNLPFGEKTMGLRLFRNEIDGSTFIAAGTMDDPVCTIEFWKNDAFGRLVPVDGPDEPAISDFLKKGRKLPRNAQATILVCLDIGGVVARPVFWNKRGMLDIPLDNAVNFKWENGKFEKEITPIR